MEMTPKQAEALARLEGDEPEPSTERPVPKTLEERLGELELRVEGLEQIAHPPIALELEEIVGRLVGAELEKRGL